MATLKDISVGERWAYRRSDADALTEVEVREISDTKPARIAIVYVAPPQTDPVWVPPSRLQVRWLERERFLRQEAQWHAISSRPNNVERMAVTAVVDEFIRPAATIRSGKRMGGTIAIYDPDLVDVFMGGGLEEVLQGAPHFAEGGADHYSWEIAVEIAKRTCSFKPDRVMAFVQAEEKSDWFESSGGQTGSLTMRLLEASTRQSWDLMRNWCGRESPSLVELAGLRGDNARLSAVFELAVTLIARQVDEAKARELFSKAYPEAEEAAWRAILHRALTGAE